MKKKIFPFAVLAVTLASCSQDELAPVQPNTVDNPNVISFVSATTRATVNNLDVMKGNTDGFKVYATGSDVTNAWYSGIDGTNNYKATAGIWDWTTTTPKRPQWPTATETGKWPMNFYAYFPQTADGFNSSATPITTLEAEITVQQTITAQTDFLAAKATVAAKPTTGFLPLTFSHIMSKVGFKVTQADGLQTEIVKLGFEAIQSKNTYDYLTGNWKTSISTPQSFLDYITFTTKAEVNGNGTPQAIGTVGQFYMFIPQQGGTGAGKTPLWDGRGTEADGEITPTGAYIQMLYRTNETAGTDILGFAARASHNVETEWNSTANSNEYNKYKISGSYTEGLYLKVGFKLDEATLNWTKGKGYTYDLKLNNAGGIYLSKYYYDKDGNNTKIPVVGGNVEPGDPVFGDDIMFTVTETTWEDQAGSNIQ